MKGRSREIYALFSERFPQAFPADVRQCRPLKIGINEDLARELPEEDPKAIAAALGYHTHRPAYLKAMLTHPERVDLQGNPAGEVTDTAREVAARRYEEAKAVTKARAEAKKAAAKAQQQAVEARQQQGKGEARAKAKSPPQSLPEPSAAAPTPAPPTPKPARRPTLTLKGKK